MKANWNVEPYILLNISKIITMEENQPIIVEPNGPEY
jgi:hypothetical protein